MTEAGAFDEFAVAVSPRLLGAARLICGDGQLAEDLVQETLIRVCLHWTRIQKRESAAAYPYRTLMRLASRSRRRLYHSREIPVGRASDLERSLAGVLDGDLQDVDRIVVHALLAQLPPRQRQTLILRFFADLSVETTAEVIQRSAGTVKSQTAKGLAALRDHLSADAAPASQEWKQS